jgi:transposase
MALKEVVAQLEALERRTIEVEKQIVRRLKTDPVAKHLLTVPGIGPIGAALLRATVPDPTIFASGRAFAAWLGLTPRQRSTGGRTKLGHVSKRGNGHIRRVLVIGAVSTIFGSRRMGGDPWLAQLRGRKPLFVTAVALANKMARICWAVMVRGTDYRVPAAA